MKEIEFKEGDLVYSIQVGWGRIEEKPSLTGVYPVEVLGCSYTRSGKHCESDKSRSLLTKEEAILLGIKPPTVKKTYWVNIYKKSDGVITGISYKTEEEARKTTNSCFGYIKTISFEIEEEL